MKGRKKGRRVGSRWRHRGCLHDEEMEGSEQRGESLDHLFMRPEMIAEVCAVEGALSVYAAFGRWIKTVRQWGRDLGLRPRLENMPQRWPRCYFLTSNPFSFRFAYLSDSLQSFPPFHIFPPPFSFCQQRGKGTLQKGSSNLVYLIESCGWKVSLFQILFNYRVLLFVLTY